MSKSHFIAKANAPSHSPHDVAGSRSALASGAPTRRSAYRALIGEASAGQPVYRAHKPNCVNFMLAQGVLACLIFRSCRAFFKIMPQQTKISQSAKLSGTPYHTSFCTAALTVALCLSTSCAVIFVILLQLSSICARNPCTNAGTLSSFI